MSNNAQSSGSTSSGLPRLGFTMKETAAILNISYMSVFRLTKRGLLKPSNGLRTKIFSLQEIERYLRDTK
jgi:hypothetical protein